MIKITVNTAGAGREFVKGNKALLFKSQEAAEKQSRKVTTNPKAIVVYVDLQPFYLAGGDWFIRPDKTRGQYIYGRGGKLVHMIDEVNNV